MITFILHAFFATAIAYILSAVFGSLSTTIAVFSLLSGYAMARGRARQLRLAFPDLEFFKFSEGIGGVFEVVLCVLILYVSVRHFGWLFFKMDSRWFTLNPNNFGDLPLHINYIKQMASGAVFPPVNPSFSTEHLLYPFGPDLYSALWDKLGVSISGQLFIIGLVCTIATLTVLKWYGGWWATGAFFLSGGFAGWSIINGDAITKDLTQGVDWKNLFLSVFVTQRGVLFALPCGILLIEATRRWFESYPLKKTVFTTLGLLWGWLPLFHLHAFVIVSLTMAGFALAEDGVRGLKRLLTSRMAYWAYAPAIYFVFRSSDFMKKVSILKVDPWWTTTLDDAPRFMLFNFGPWLVLPAVIGICLLVTKRFAPARRRALIAEFLIYLALFTLFFNVMLAPWSWDNIKLLIFPYLGFARLAWVIVDPILPELSKPSIALVLFFSGFLALNFSIAPPMQRAVAIYQVSQLGQTEGAVAEVPVNAVFAAAPTHDHPLTYFGRIRAVGYEGHLWSHGIDYHDRYAKTLAFMRGEWNGEDAAKMARSLGITHIFWGAPETSFFKSEPHWPASFKNVSRVPDLHVYEVPK